jgi:hypothetical protein
MYRTSGAHGLYAPLTQCLRIGLNSAAPMALALRCFPALL